jgi:hypothetical protein
MLPGPSALQSAVATAVDFTFFAASDVTKTDRVSRQPRGVVGSDICDLRTVSDQSTVKL